MSAAPAGWYPDPAAPRLRSVVRLRWFDGEHWTPHVRPPEDDDGAGDLGAGGTERDVLQPVEVGPLTVLPQVRLRRWLGRR